MYQLARSRRFAQPTGMGFSLKPPSWLVDEAKKLIGSAFRGTQVTIQTPAGPQVFDISTPGGIAALQAMIASAKIGKPTPTPSPVQQANDFVQSRIPGGWLTIAGGALVLFLLLKRR